ncbi:MAG: DUF3147 family protein [Acidobacteriota bacterium]|nr:DUF3147 family protein [Acidobacteriota bacterium]
MAIKIDASVLHETKWHEYALRFLFGGIVTLAAGLIADHWGPVVGGLFLAFPSIFPASLTLVAKHQEQRKANKGMHGEERGKDAAATEAAGTSMGSIGLLAFAGVIWWGFPHFATWAVLIAATVTWMLVSALVWMRRQFPFTGRSPVSAPKRRVRPH